jgi:membrane fusion protein (multidrug efflux system)
MSAVTVEHPNPLAQKRKKLLAIVLAVMAIGGLAAGIYWAWVARYVESTDDAYVSGNVVQIMPQVTGTVVAINADDTQFVKAGQVLVELDKSDSHVALEQAEAQLAKTVRRVRNLMATTGEVEATLAERNSAVEQARADLARRESLAPSGAVSGEELAHARDALTKALAARDAAQQQLRAVRALTDRTTIDTHPEVKEAAAKLREVYLNYARTALPAPVSGLVAKRSVQVGQRVGPGTPLMTVVPLDQVWVDANFKEGQIAHLRQGQPVKLIADAYGNSVVYHGKVAGFGAGTGGAFALLPAQNASGNWIKVVQRIPVRIALDPKELAQHPLQVGLSMEVDVDTHDRAGVRLPNAPTAHAQSYQTNVFASLDDLASREVTSIIAANMDRAPDATRLAHHHTPSPGVAGLTAISAPAVRELAGSPKP